MDVRADRKYTEEHEWVKVEADGRVRVGITDFAQDALGDIVYVDLPEVGATIAKGDTMAEVESTKSVGEVYAPLSGSIVAVNEVLVDAPETVNMSPFDDGWIVLIETDEAAAIEALLDADGYREITE